MGKVIDPKTDAQIHYGRRENLRKLFKEHGLSAFNECQVLEYALGIAIPRIDTNPIAHRLINTFGSLDGVINAHPDKLEKVAGVGENTACFISFLKEFVTFYMAHKTQNEKIKTPNDAIVILRDYMKTHSEEVFIVMCLDKSGEIVARHEVAGNIDRVSVDMREIVERAMRTKTSTSAIICAHNHVDGHCAPSDADMNLTRQLVNVLIPLGINFVDHIIFADENEYSFARNGIIEIFRREHREFSAPNRYEESLRRLIDGQ